MAAIIRDYRPGDEAAAYYVCLKTGDSGNDGEPFYREDPDALGRIYVGPYLRFEPELSLILEDEHGVCGYALAALDSKDFYHLYETQWLPELQSKFPDPTGEPATWSRVEAAYHVYHHPDHYCPEPYKEYPAHLHIDLLPRAHRQGHGRRMMSELMNRLKQRGAPGVHLCMAATNDRAHAFYTSLGFKDLCRHGPVNDECIYMGKRLDGE